MFSAASLKKRACHRRSSASFAVMPLGEVVAPLGDVLGDLRLNDILGIFKDVPKSPATGERGFLPSGLPSGTGPSSGIATDGDCCVESGLLLTSDCPEEQETAAARAAAEASLVDLLTSKLLGEWEAAAVAVPSPGEFPVFTHRESTRRRFSRGRAGDEDEDTDSTGGGRIFGAASVTCLIALAARPITLDSSIRSLSSEPEPRSPSLINS